MNDDERRNFEEFFKVIEPNLPGYQHSIFSYFALKRGSAFELAQGRLALQGVPAQIPSSCFRSENIKAGIFRLSEVKMTPNGFVEELLTGKLRTPQGDFQFPAENGRSHSVYLSSLHPDGISAQRRQIQLNISGDRRQRIDSTLLDWELKGASTPFFNVQELCDEFLIGQIRGDSVNVEIIAFNVAVVAAESSIEETKAKLVIVIADGLAIQSASIGYRVFDRNRVTKRGLLAGSELKWQKIENVQRGIGELEVPSGAVVDCVANYAGVAQNHFWIADPKTAQNPFRSVHHAFDNNLEVLRDLIDRAQRKGADARDLEMAVSWLLWLLGFSATRIGGTSKTSDAPDLIAATPTGNLVVIECTTGILREDSKLAHLVQRAERVRQSLASCGHQHLRVLPLIVTTKTRDEVKAELDQAYKLGVLVATSEDFPQMINRTLLLPDPSRLYAEAEETLHRLQNPPILPGLEGFK
jgi:Holliday junction resolvase